MPDICDMGSLHNAVETQIKKYSPGQIFFLSDFRGIGTDSAIRKALSRITQEKQIERIARGIYYIPQRDPLLGELLPSVERIIEMIARREKIRIKPTGVYALHKLGLSTQVPMKLVYLTDGTKRKIKIGKMVVHLKPATPKKLSLQGHISSLIVSALTEVNPKDLNEDQATKIKILLKQENKRKLNHDLRLAPARITDFLFKLLQPSEK